MPIKCMRANLRMYDGTPPTALPVDLELVKSQAAIDPSDTTFDVLLTTYVKVLTKQIQDWIGKTLITTNYSVGLDFGFPCCVEIGDGPNVVIDRVQYIPDGGTDYEVLDPKNYEIITTQHFIQIFSAPGIPWPETEFVPEAAEIYYSAGFGADHTAVPDEIQLAIAMSATKALNQRGDCDCAAPVNLLSSASNLLKSYKPYCLSNIMSGGC